MGPDLAQGSWYVFHVLQGSTGMRKWLRSASIAARLRQKVECCVLQVTSAYH